VLVGARTRQALSQCDGYLRSMEGAVREAVYDTAGAAQAVVQNEWRCAG
jgi:prephenate dehydratase